MNEFLSKWTPGQFLALAAIFFGAIAIVSIVWVSLAQAVRLTRIGAELKQEMLRRGLSVGEIERLLAAPTACASPREPDSTDEEAVGEIAGNLSAHEAPPAEIERVMGLLRATDSPTLHAVHQTVNSMAESGADADQLIAAIRGLCRPSHTFDEARSVMADS